jgi:hypothetical protein
VERKNKFPIEFALIGLIKMNGESNELSGNETMIDYRAETLWGVLKSKEGEEEKSFFALLRQSSRRNS